MEICLYLLAETFDCHLTDVKPLLYHDWDHHDNGFTIVNQGPPKCVTPFMRTQFGCLCLYQPYGSFATDRRHCGLRNADLLVLEDDSQRLALWTMLVNHYGSWTLNIEIWVGVINGTWLNGVQVAHSVATTPGPPTTCGTLGTGGVIVNKDCNVIDPHFLCQMVVHE
ncbi:uncharacterized protein [Palaemon carinicauda]|uniref:uncharacterized protein n=1 Tax=Palaemon carinicauda TaxID=392227 RepID=UPI0035B60035